MKRAHANVSSYASQSFWNEDQRNEKPTVDVLEMDAWNARLGTSVMFRTTLGRRHWTLIGGRFLDENRSGCEPKIRSIRENPGIRSAYLFRNFESFEMILSMVCLRCFASADRDQFSFDRQPVEGKPLPNSSLTSWNLLGTTFVESVFFPSYVRNLTLRQTRHLDIQNRSCLVEFATS